MSHIFDEVKASVMSWITDRPPTFFVDRLTKLVRSKGICVTVNGDFVCKALVAYKMLFHDAFVSFKKQFLFASYEQVCIIVVPPSYDGYYMIWLCVSPAPAASFAPVSGLLHQLLISCTSCWFPAPVASLLHQ